MCLGELTRVGGEDVMPHVPELMQVIMSRLADPSLPKRDAALHTLGQVCSSTGYVVAPLVDHPQLLQILSRILRTESKQSVRREVIKVLGILGALDPYRRKVSLLYIKLRCALAVSQIKPEEEAPTEVAATLANATYKSYIGTSTASDDYYQTVAINALLDILKDQQAYERHHKVIEAIMSIFKTQGLKCVTFLPQVRLSSKCNKLATQSHWRLDHSSLCRRCESIWFSYPGLSPRTACHSSRNHQTARSQLYAKHF